MSTFQSFISEEIRKNLQENLPQKTYQFIMFHGPQLKTIGFDFSDLKQIESLYCKLENEIFDAGKYFDLFENQDEQHFQLQTKEKIEPGEYFLIDHAMTFQYEQFKSTLIQNPQLIPRFLNMTKYSFFKTPEVVDPLSQNFEFQEIQNPLDCEISSWAETLDFYGNNISDLDNIRKLFCRFQNVKAIWLNDNPLDEQQLIDMVENEFHFVQMINSKFTKNAEEFIFKYVSLGMSAELANETLNQNIYYLNFSDRSIFNVDKETLLSMGIIFENVKKLNLTGNDLNTHLIKPFLQQFQNLEQLIIDNNQQEFIYEQFQKNMIDCPKLQQINGFYFKENQFVIPSQQEYDIRQLYTQIWPFCGQYRIANSSKESQSTIYYIMDEVGSAIQHSEHPNCEIHPFLFSKNFKLDQDMIAYNLLIIKEIIEPENKITRNVFKEIKDFKEARLQLESEINFIEKWKIYQNALTNSIQQLETISQIDNSNPFLKYPIRFYTDSKLIEKAITNEKFLLVEEIENSNIIWVNEPLKDNFCLVFPQKFLNQFPYEISLTLKSSLAKIVQKYYLNTFVPVTYDLTSQYDEFMGHFLYNQQNYLNNLWIIKHPNLARSMDMVVTDNKDVINQLSLQVPRLAQKYIHSPALIQGHKFDLRFIVALKSLYPLELFVYKKFWIRIANEPFTLDFQRSFNYATHFTVNNYGGQKLKKMLQEEFIQIFNQQYKNQWEKIYENILQIFKQLFTAFQKDVPLMHYDKSRAIYGVDLMIDDKMKPNILEMTYAPDCHRAVEYYPDFFNDIFEVLFLGQEKETLVRI